MTFPAHLPDIDGLLSETEMSELRLRFAERCNAVGIDATHADAGPIYLDIVSSFLSGWSGRDSADGARVAASPYEDA